MPDQKIKNKIKSCPFCGKDEGEDSYDEERNRVIHCMNCGADGPWAEQLSDAIELWNERKTEELAKSVKSASEAFKEFNKAIEKIKRRINES